MSTMLRFGGEGAGDKVDALFDAEEDIALVLVAQIFEGERFPREEHTLFIGQVAADFDARLYLRFADFRDLEDEEPVVEQDGISGFQIVDDLFIRDGYARLVAFDIFGGEGKFVSLFEGDPVIFESPDAQFRALRVQHDGQGDVQFFAHFFDELDVFLRALRNRRAKS